ncbi:MAG: EAL domain-containing protein [Gammaproteobacteria bacterium]
MANTTGWRRQINIKPNDRNSPKVDTQEIPVIQQECRPAEELLLELQLHQTELEMQSNELRRSHAELEKSRDQYIDLYDFAPVGYLTLTHKGLIAKINLTAASMLGENRSNLLNRRFAALVAPQNGDNYYLFFADVMKHNKPCNIELMLIRYDGTLLNVHLDCLSVISSDHDPMLRIVLIDISARKTAESNLRIAAIAFESQEGMMITDANGAILRVNNAFTNITGYTLEEVIGKNPRILQSMRHKSDFYAAMWTDININGSWSGEIWNRRKNGDCYPGRLTITAVKDTYDIVTNYVGTLTDITLSLAAADEIKYLAFYDPLTGLPNRRLLRDRLKLALTSSHRSGQKGALLFIDLDNFKTLNDCLGHDKGDLLLKQVAEYLEPIAREGDMVARMGGDEFVVMLESLSEHTLEAAAQTEVIGNKILTTLNQPYLLAEHSYQCTCSIGAVLFNNSSQSIDELLKQADIAMYQAKAAGGNTLRFFDPQMQIRIDARVALEAALRLALTENQFKLYYQPQVYHTGQVIGAEVLIRWQHPQNGFISPADFIPLAEATGLILPIGQWVLENACAQLKIWKGNEHTQNLQLAVNVSSHQFHQTDFVEQVRQVISRSSINPARLKLELTESLVIGDIDETILKMNVLREIGVCFSMDDFGTGYSSLSSLKKLPLSQLKIDQSFVRDLSVDPDDAAIVQTIVAMAKSLGMGVIAEGVETEAQRSFLEQHDCPLYQGYLFSKPVPIEQFEALLNIN